MSTIIFGNDKTLLLLTAEQHNIGNYFIMKNIFPSKRQTSIYTAMSSKHKIKTATFFTARFLGFTIDICTYLIIIQ